MPGASTINVEHLASAWVWSPPRKKNDALAYSVEIDESRRSSVCFAVAALTLGTWAGVYALSRTRGERAVTRR